MPLAALATYRLAASAIVGALLVRCRTGRGQSLSIRVHEVAAAMSQNLVAQHSCNGSFPARGPCPGLLRRVPVQRRVGHGVLPREALCAALGDPAPGRDPRFASTNALVRNWSEACARLAPILLRLTVDEFVRRAGQARALAAGVNTMAGMLGCGHLATRRF